MAAVLAFFCAGVGAGDGLGGVGRERVVAFGGAEAAAPGVAIAALLLLCLLVLAYTTPTL